MKKNLPESIRRDELLLRRISGCFWWAGIDFNQLIGAMQLNESYTGVKHTTWCIFSYMFNCFMKLKHSSVHDNMFQ